MRLKPITFFIPAFLFFHSYAFCQLLTNDALISVNGNALLFVDGGITNEKAGNFLNNATIQMTGDWTNNGGTGFLNSLPGTLQMNGANQAIKGTNVTNFYNLDLLGTGVKSLVGIDALSQGILSLNDRELATGDNMFTVANTSLGAITLTTGFVSSTNAGALARNTAAQGSYLFPVGSSQGSLRYCPVAMSLPDDSANTFTVRFANVEATTEGYNLLTKQSSISEINAAFYHRINRTAGNDAAGITIYFDSTADGSFNALLHWQNTPEWETTVLNPVVVNNALGSLSSIAIPSWKNYSYTPFALANESFCLVPNAFSPNGDGHNDTLYVRGVGLTSFTLQIYDRFGNKVFETSDLQTGWDGKYKGKEEADQVFVYYLVVSGTLVKKGDITLLR